MSRQQRCSREGPVHGRRRKLAKKASVRGGQDSIMRKVSLQAAQVVQVYGYKEGVNVMSEVHCSSQANKKNKGPIK